MSERESLNKSIDFDFLTQKDPKVINDAANAILDIVTDPQLIAKRGVDLDVSTVAGIDLLRRLEQATR